MQFQLDDFDAAAMARLGPEVCDRAEALLDMGEAAQQIVQLMDEVMRMPDGREPGLALARIYVTRRFGALDAEQAAFARKLAGKDLEPTTPCMCLIGSQGRRAEWCDPRKSAGHLAIPLLSREWVESLPMMWKLLDQLGIDIEALLEHKLTRDSKLRRFGLGTFHIAEAAGSPWVPGQEFVAKEGVKSCVAIGGVLPDGEIFTLLLFSKQRVGNESILAIQPLALILEIALLPYIGLSPQAEIEAKLYAYQRLLGAEAGRLVKA